MKNAPASFVLDRFVSAIAAAALVIGAVMVVKAQGQLSPGQPTVAPYAYCIDDTSGTPCPQPPTPQQPSNNNCNYVLQSPYYCSNSGLDPEKCVGPASVQCYGSDSPTSCGIQMDCWTGQPIVDDDDNPTSCSQTIADCTSPE